MAAKPLEIRSILSKNVKEQRKKLGLTLEKLAESSGLAVQTINDIEGGRRWVSDTTITKLSDALGIESYQLLIADFFGQDRKKETPTQQLVAFKKKIVENVNSQIESQFNDFLKSGCSEMSRTPVQRKPEKGRSRPVDGPRGAGKATRPC